MKLRLRHLLLLFTLYTLAILAPLAIVLIGPLPPSRGFWIEFSCALGFVGLAMMGAQFALTARFRAPSQLYGQDTLLQFHRQAGILAFALVFAHPVIAILARPDFISFFDPRVNLPRAGALSMVTVTLVLLIVLPLWRRRLGIPYEWWRLTHGALGFLAIAIGTAHILMVNNYITPLWKQAVWVILTTGAMGLLGHVRVLKPLSLRKRPWKVINVRSECDRVWTLTLEAAGHEGVRFLPGQFVWLTVRNSPFSLQQHPFSIASAAQSPARIELTIKELGDFTRTIRDVPVGATAFLEGPYGGFALQRDVPCDALILIAGGIGVTPIMSMLRTLAASDHKPARITLLYGAADPARAPFLDEIDSLQRTLGVDVTFVYETPPPGWTGDRGVIDDALLNRRLPPDTPQSHYFICGPDAMLDTVESALRRRGISLWRMHSERFNIV